MGNIGFIDHAWHSKDLDTFVKANYPEGSEELPLIHDFTSHGYKFLPNTCAANKCPGILTVPAYCSWFFGAWSGAEIWWTRDDAGKIMHLTARRTYCTLSF